LTAAASPVRLAESRPWAWAMLWVVALGPFFFLSYGFANWVTGLRAGVPSLVFGWERHIPFLAWTIVPYWSTDLFYALSLFLCATRTELNTHARRLLAVQIISVAGFLLFPLRFSFDRPDTAGLYGWMFDALNDFDRPFNQAPSLHLGLTTILWAKYLRHLTGVPRWLMRGWFILMGLSTLTTYQHHFIDLPTGIWAGLLCLVLFPDKPTPSPSKTTDDSRKFVLSGIYLAGALLLIWAIRLLGGAAWLLLWPAGSLLIVSAIYQIGRPELFRKTDGVMARPMIVLLAPYLMAAWLSSRLQTRGEAPAQEIADGVWLGRMPRRAERDSQGVASLVDLTAELPVDTNGVAYRGIPMLDLLLPTRDQLEAAVNAIQELEHKRPTLVCCALGLSRSASAVAAWLVASGRDRSVDESINRIETRRRIVLRPAARKRLEEWAQAR